MVIPAQQRSSIPSPVQEFSDGAWRCQLLLRRVCLHCLQGSLAALEAVPSMSYVWAKARVSCVRMTWTGWMKSGREQLLPKPGSRPAVNGSSSTSMSKLKACFALDQYQ